MATAKQKMKAKERMRANRETEQTARDEDEIESTEEIEEDEPRTMEEATAKTTKTAKKAAKKVNAAPKLTPEQRRAKRAEEDAAIRAKGGVVRTATGKASARGLPCLCGCGGATVTDEARFISGHDAQFRSRVLKEEQNLDSPESRWIKPFYEAGEVVAGFSLEGGELADQHA